MKLRVKLKVGRFNLGWHFLIC